VPNREAVSQRRGTGPSHRRTLREKELISALEQVAGDWYVGLNSVRHGHTISTWPPRVLAGILEASFMNS
jgi:hypothetical protein